MTSKPVITLLCTLALVATIFLPLFSSGCLEDVPRPGWVFPKPGEGNSLFIGITVRVRIVVHVDISPQKTSTEVGWVTGEDLTFRDYTVSADVSASVTPDRPENILFPTLSRQPTAAESADYQDYVLWDDTVKQWSGSTYNSDGQVKTTEVGVTPETPGTGDHTIAKPSHYLSLAGLSLNLDSIVGRVKEAANQVFVRLDFDIMQLGKVIQPIKRVLSFNLPKFILDHIPDIEYEFEVYIPFGGRFIVDDFEIQFFKFQQTYRVGFKTSFIHDPASYFIDNYIPWARSVADWVADLFGADFPQYFWRLDYDICRYFEALDKGQRTKSKAIDIYME